MPLDPLLKTILDKLNETPAPPAREIEPAVLRANFARMMEGVGAKDVPIGKVENITMPGPGGEIELRVYSPVAGGGASLPGLVYYHGGGWVFGDLDSYDGICRILANEASVRVIAVNYRRAPEHKFPAAVDDAIAALQWVEANASSLGVDANRLAVGGDSAGGGLVAVVTQQAKAKGGPKLAYQMMFYPVTQLVEETDSIRDFAKGYFLERESLLYWYELYLPDDADRADPRISPLLAEDVSGLPPAYVMLAGFDPLRDEGLAYVEKLRDAGVTVNVAEYPDMVHEFIYMVSVLPQAERALHAAAAALKEAMAE